MSVVTNNYTSVDPVMRLDDVLAQDNLDEDIDEIPEDLPEANEPTNKKKQAKQDKKKEAKQNAKLKALQFKQHQEEQKAQKAA